MPDYEIIRWDESNFAIDNAFLKEHIQKKQWAFVSDYARMRVLIDNGGIYLDADIEAVKSFDPLLENRCFLGYEANGRPNTGVMGSLPKHPFLAECMQVLEDRHIRNISYLIAPEVAKLVLSKSSKMQDVIIYPPEYFYPYNPYDPAKNSEQLMFADITEKTYGIHHWGKSWKLGPLERLERFVRRAIAK